MFIPLFLYLFIYLLAYLSLEGHKFISNFNYCQMYPSLNKVAYLILFYFFCVSSRTHFYDEFCYVETSLV